MSALDRALKEFIQAAPSHIRFALVGGMCDCGDRLAVRSSTYCLPHQELMPEAVAGAERIELASGLIAPVARVGHLIAMKLVSRDAKRRPNDQQDLVNLAKVADEQEWSCAESSIDLIRMRGYHRGRDLHAGLAELRAIWRDA